MISKSITLAALVTVATVALPAIAQPTSRLAAIGDLDSILVGQKGYCGDRAYVPRSSWMDIPLQGGERTFMRIKGSPHFRYRCVGEYSFQPAVGKAYIVRYTLAGNRCLFELFRVVPGGAPVGETLTSEEPRSCLMQ